MIYSSTVVSKGRGQAIVTGTGMDTEIGKVASELSEGSDGDNTRLQKSLNKMYVMLLIAAIVSAIIILASVKFQTSYDIAMYAITAALSVLPAGLTTVMTVTLVLGGKEMTRQRAIVRKLKCLETLGSITHIFSDKTGTLTMARMVVVRFWIPEEGFFYVQPNGLAPKGEVYRTFDDMPDVPTQSEKSQLVSKNKISHEVDLLVKCAALCNMSSITKRQPSIEYGTATHKEYAHSTATRPISSVIDSSMAAHGHNIERKDEPDDSDDYIGSGAPTEIALQVFAHKFCMGKPQLMGEECWELIEEYQFDSTIKRMSTVWYNRPVNRNMIFSKGAAERILPLCNNLTTKESQDNVMNQVHQLASKGLRVLALAYRDAQGIDVNNIVKQENGRELIECDLTFLGLTGGELNYNSCILLTI